MSDHIKEVLEAERIKLKSRLTELGSESTRVKLRLGKVESDLKEFNPLTEEEQRIRNLIKNCFKVDKFVRCEAVKNACKHDKIDNHPFYKKELATYKQAYSYYSEDEYDDVIVYPKEFLDNLNDNNGDFIGDCGYEIPFHKIFPVYIKKD